MAHTAIKLRESNGILAEHKLKQGRPLPTSTIDAVRYFYLDDNNSFTRILPGKKDFVSVGYKLHEQKRLILCNLVELYAAFMEKYPQIKIGFSSFASLRPKQYVTVGASGTHSVCVRTIHQNSQLLVNALDLQKDIHPTYRHDCL